MTKSTAHLGESEYMDVEDCARLLGTTPGALHVQRHRNQPPGNLGVRVGRRVKYRRSDIESWFDDELARAGAVDH